MGRWLKYQAPPLVFKPVGRFVLAGCILLVVAANQAAAQSQTASPSAAQTSARDVDLTVPATEREPVLRQSSSS